MTALSDTDFKRRCPSHLKHFRLRGLQPKTIEAYACAIRRIGAYSDHPIDDLSETPWTDYSAYLCARRHPPGRPG
jgi:integrase/recombinase XerD